MTSAIFVEIVDAKALPLDVRLREGSTRHYPKVVQSRLAAYALSWVGMISMGAVMRNALLATSVVVMILLQPLTLIAMVIAPRCIGIEQQANIFKVVSIVAFSAAYYLLALRRASLRCAIVIPAAQIAVGWWFLGYINGLPMACPR